MMGMTGARALRVAQYVGVGGLTFQVVHFLEHTLQAGYWMGHTSQPPWLTPWAAAGRDMLAFGGNPGTGTELLHLIGNVIFFAGLVALCNLVYGYGARLRDVPALAGALWVQGFHVFEHLLLTGTYLVAGRALGFSTLFGALEGAVLGGTRVWWHFTINLVATVLAVRAGVRMYQLDLLLPGAGAHTARAQGI